MGINLYIQFNPASPLDRAGGGGGKHFCKIHLDLFQDPIHFSYLDIAAMLQF